MVFPALVATLLGCTAAAAQTTTGQTGRPTLALTNRSGQEIEELYVSSTQASGWGDDRLGDKVIEKNATFRLRLAEGCLYDLQVVYADNRTEERMRVNLCRTPAQVFTAAEAHAAPPVPTHEFTLDNRSTRTITGVSVADTSDGAGEEEWGDSLLTGNLVPGTGAKLTFTGECQTAVRVVYDNGSVEQRHSVDLCAGAKELAVAPGWTTQEEPGNAAPAPEPAGLVTVSNRGGARMTELFVYSDDAGAGDPERRDERLGTRVLEPGGEVQIALQRDGKCLFTVRGVFAGDVPDQVQSGIDFCPRRTVDVGAR